MTKTQSNEDVIWRKSNLMNVTGVSSSGNLPDEARAAKAGAQFEAILLNMVFGDLERVFSHFPGAKEDAVSRSYNGFGMEALSAGLAKSGGIGLGKFIAKALTEYSKHGTHRI